MWLTMLNRGEWLIVFIKAEYKKANPRLSNYLIELPANMVGEFSVNLSSEDVVTINGETVNPSFGSVRNDKTPDS